jgi:hypothetical protein
MATTDTHIIIEELLEAAFSMWSMLRLHKEWKEWSGDSAVEWSELVGEWVSYEDGCSSVLVSCCC